MGGNGNFVGWCALRVGFSEGWPVAPDDTMWRRSLGVVRGSQPRPFCCYEIEALPIRVTRTSHRTEPPLPDGSGLISCLLKDLSHRNRLATERILSFLELREALPCLPVAANLGPAKMLARHQNTARWGTDRNPAVMTGKAHPFGCKCIRIGSRDLLLPVAAQFAISQIICKNEDHVGSIGGKKADEKESGRGYGRKKRACRTNR